MRACTEVGVTAGFHVIGDAAVARCGHRLEHLEMVTAEQAAKLGAWGVIASVQSNFAALWGGSQGMYARRLGAERGSRLNRFALLASQGMPIAFGSDAPVTEIDPWRSVHAAANARTGTLVPGAPASYAVWDVGELCEARVVTGSRVPALPRLSPTGAWPRCRPTVHRGVVLYG